MRGGIGEVWCCEQACVLRAAVIVHDACVIKRDGWLTVLSLAGLDVCLSVAVVIADCLPSFKVRRIISVSNCFVLPRYVALRSLVNLKWR